MMVWAPLQPLSITTSISLNKSARCVSLLFLASLLLQDAALLPRCNGTGVSASPLPLPLQMTREPPLYIGEETHSGSGESIRTRLRERQILPPAGSHPLTFIPGAFTRDAAAAACGPGKKLAAVDAYNWGAATSMTGGLGAWISSWNTDSYGGTCIALYSSNSINVPPQGCAQPLGALCEPGAPVSAPPPPPPPPAKKKPPPAKKPPPKKPAPKKKGGKL